MDYLEINAKLKEAENTIQLLKEALTNTMLIHKIG